MLLHPARHLLPRAAPAHTERREGHPVVGHVLERDHRELAPLRERVLDPLDQPRSVAAARAQNGGADHHVDQLLCASVRSLGADEVGIGRPTAVATARAAATRRVILIPPPLLRVRPVISRYLVPNDGRLF